MNILSKILIIMILLMPVGVYATWHTLSTDSFMIYYRSGMEAEALHALKVMEYYSPRLESMTGNSSGRTAVKLEDMGNLVNGYANPVGNVIGLYMYPPTKDELAYCEDWFQMVAPHEYIHKLQMTHAGGIPWIIRGLFGNYFYPQLHQPMWMTEGITVYGESQLSPYAGRMNGAFYSSLVAALAREDRLPSPVKAAYYSMDSPLAHYYVFGGSFHQFLADSYGEERFAELYKSNSSNILAYSNAVTPALALDVAFNEAYGKSLPALWSQWQEREKAKAPLQTAKRITFDGYEKTDLKEADGALYYIERQQDKVGSGTSYQAYCLKRLPLKEGTNSSQVLIRQATDFPASYHIANGAIYYSRTEYESGFANIDNDGFGSISQILVKNGSGSKMLYQGQVRAFLPLEDGKLLIAEDKELYRGSVLFEYDPNSKSKKQLYNGDHLIHGIALDKDKIYVNAKGYWQASAIYRLEKGNLQAILDSPFGQKLLSVKNGEILYNTVVDNKMQAWSHLVDKKTYAKINYEDYLKDPVIAADGETYFISTNAKGLDLYQAPLKSTAQTPQTHSKNPAPFPKETKLSQDLVLGKEIKRGSAMNNLTHLLNPRILHVPQIYAAEDTLMFGAILMGSDALGYIPQYSLEALYDADEKELIGTFNLVHKFFKRTQQSITLSSVDEGTFVLNQAFMLLNKQNYGLNEMYLGLGILGRQQFKEKMLYPYLINTFSWADGRAQIRNNVYWESEAKLQSAKYRLGWQGDLAIKQRLVGNSEIQSAVHLGYDPDADSDEVFSSLRGYSKELPGNTGFTVQNTLSFPVFKARAGLWNPQIYLEDISLGLFADAAAYDNEALDFEQYSYGVELIGEFYLAFNAAAKIGLRYGMKKDKSTFWALILGI